MEKFDVIIIGAGPAGLSCAKELSNSNKKVLLLEKNNIIGPKVCAGGITNHDLEQLKLPKELLDKRYKQIIIHTPFHKDIIKQDKPFVYTIDRETLGQWQLKNIKTDNIIIKTESRVTEINNNYIVVDNKKIKFKYLVGADGSSSSVRRFLKLKSNRKGIAIQYIIPTKKYKKIEMFFDSKLFGSGYAWIFPHKSYVSIGCGCDPKVLSSKKVINNFNKWLKSNKIDVSKGKYEANPINFDYQGYKFKNIFLTGDAAGLASGLTGEGIYQALISGEEIAKIILDKKYKSTKMDELIRSKNMHNKVLNFLEKSGPIRKIEYELLGLLLKSKWIDKKIINTFI